MNITAERIDHHVALTDDWSLWRDFAIRSSGFPVEGLEAFGPDEDARLAAVARDPAFREAVAWQSRESLARAVDKLAAGAPGGPSRTRRRQDVVASYWQRYCSKNDTIGFFGPLAWGSFSEQGEAIAVRSGALERERVVHLETWAVEAVAAAAGVTTPLPMGPFPERALRGRHARARAPGRRARRRGRRAARGHRRRARPSRSRVRGDHRAAGDARRGRQRRRAHGRLPRLACATST